MYSSSLKRNVEEKFEISCTKNHDYEKSNTYKFDTLDYCIDYYYENNLFESEFIEVFNLSLSFILEFNKFQFTKLICTKNDV